MLIHCSPECSIVRNSVEGELGTVHSDAVQNFFGLNLFHQTMKTVRMRTSVGYLQLGLRVQLNECE